VKYFLIIAALNMYLPEKVGAAAGNAPVMAATGTLELVDRSSRSLSDYAALDIDRSQY
jgi:hypothetical protein